MSDVFYVKEGSTSPSITATLTDPDNAPVDLTGATITFRMVGPDIVTGTASIDGAPADGNVVYDWAAGDLDTWGGYALEWVVVQGGNTDIFPGAGYNYVDVVPAVTTDIGGVCTIVDVRRNLGRDLTDAETMRAITLIGEVTALLQRRLNRIFAPTTITETHRIDSRGTLQLFKGPVIAVTGINVDAVAWDGVLDDWNTSEFVAGGLVEVTYTAGSDEDVAVCGLIAQVVARTLLAPTTVSAGTVSGYSVEGTSITYGDVSGTGMGSVGRLNVGDLGSLARLRRWVMRT